MVIRNLRPAKALRLALSAFHKITIKMFLDFRKTQERNKNYTHACGYLNFY